MSFKSKKLRDSARNQDCMVRIPGICNFNPETTVLAHVAKGGMGQKGNDYHATFACSNCHDEIDGRAVRTDFTPNELKIMVNDGMQRTQDYWFNVGLMSAK